MRWILIVVLAWCSTVGSASAVIMAKVELEQVIQSQPLIMTLKISDWLPDKPAMVLVPGKIMQGKFNFERIPVNLAGDAEAQKEKQPAMLLERLEKDLEFVVFAARRGKNFDAVCYTNGTWFRLAGSVEVLDGKEVTRWRFTHCEPYFRRTFRGTTAEMLQAIETGLKGGKLPAYDEKEPPGYGPPLKEKKSHLPNGSPFRTGLFAVVQLPFLGLIAALAAIFPAVFGGLALMMRRWVVALSMASLISILAAVFMYFPRWLHWTGLKTPTQLWTVCGVLCALAALWAARRYTRARRQNQSADFQPQRLDRFGLAGLIVLLLGTLTYPWLTKQSFLDSPWLELSILVVPVAFCLGHLLGHWWQRRTQPEEVRLSSETVGLWAASAVFGITACLQMTPTTAPVTVSGSGLWELQQEPVWVFEPAENGEVTSNPLVTPERIYVTVHHRQGFSQYGRVYALDPVTGKALWEFDDEGGLKELFCSPTYADGRLFFGEGYHTNRDSKMYCVDAATGKKLWEFATSSHTESTPAVAAGKVVFGAGDDGLYCFNAATGDKLWQYPAPGEPGMHIDSNPVISNGAVYIGSGSSQRTKRNRIACVDLETGKERWGEDIDYSAWGSPTVDRGVAYFGIGNGTFSLDNGPLNGRLLARHAGNGTVIWSKNFPNSVLTKPATDRHHVYTGCKDGFLYCLDRHDGDIIWKQSLQSPVLASPAVVHYPTQVGDSVYAVGAQGMMFSANCADGSLRWLIDFRALAQMGYAHTTSSPTVMQTIRDGRAERTIIIGCGIAPTPTSTPTARVYCFREIAK
ncbi:MAG: PQQ-binding-like beta-propeller repeat protein [Zavarzinella sp.]